MATSAMAPNHGAAAPDESVAGARPWVQAQHVAGSLGCDTKLRCINKKKEGQGLGLWWPPFGCKTQGSTNIGRQQWKGLQRGRVARAERTGGVISSFAAANRTTKILLK
jgi:hypothetical protein